MKLTIDKFQKMHSISISEMGEIDKASNLVQILLDKPAEYVENLPLKKFSKLCDKLKIAFDLQVETEINKLPRKLISCGTKAYHLNFDIKNTFNTGRYIEVLTFSKEDPIMNMHNILASICTPLKWSWSKFKYVEQDFDAMKHQDYADDMKLADFRHGHHAMVFFYLLLEDLTTSIKDSLELEKMTTTENQEKQLALKKISQIFSDGFTMQSK